MLDRLVPLTEPNLFKVSQNRNLKIKVSVLPTLSLKAGHAPGLFHHLYISFFYIGPVCGRLVFSGGAGYRRFPQYAFK